MSNEYRNFKVVGEDVWCELHNCDNTADQIDVIRMALREAYQLGRDDERVGYDPEAAKVEGRDSVRTALDIPSEISALAELGWDGKPTDS